MKELFKRLLSRFGLYISKGYKVYLFSNKAIVRRNIYGRDVLMPKAHSISFNLAHFPYYNSNLQRIVQQYQQYREGPFSILDIGANIGDTLLMLRQVTDHPIRCFEGDPFYFSLLEKNSINIPRSWLHPVLLSDKPGTLKVKNNINLGTSTFTADTDGGAAADFTSIDVFAAGHFPEEAVGIIKSDTDGYDLKIIKGAACTIGKHRPVLFLEFDRTLFEKNGDDGMQFLDFLATLNYEGLLLYDNFGKLLCITSLKEKRTVGALLAYIKDQKITVPFYDLAVFPGRDQAFFDSFAASELAFFEQ
jgi:FkbM family methyltransferase